VRAFAACSSDGVGHAVGPARESTLPKRGHREVAETEVAAANASTEAPAPRGPAGAYH
jgi:hypothetical protein